jgi:hypothetical protein
MKKVGFLLNYDPNSWLGGFNVKKNLVNSFNFIKKKKLEPFIIAPNSFKKSYKKLQVPREKIIFTNFFIKQSTLFKLFNKLLIIFFGKSYIYDNFFKSIDISIVSHGLNFGLGLKSSIKSISWIPDFQHIYYPEYFSNRARFLKYINTIYSAVSSSKIILSSKDVKKDLKKTLPFAYSKTIVHPYVFDLPKKNKIISLNKIINKYKLKKKYFYIPNQFWKHKNHDIIVESLKYLKNINRDIIIVLTGFPYDHRHKEHFAQLNKKVEKYNLEKNYIYLGVLPYRDVMSLMYHAIAIINPSKFEGCSSSVEQSKSMGKKLIISNIDVHKEQNPKHRDYFDPNNEKQLAKILIKNFKHFNRKNDLKSITEAYNCLDLRLGKYANEYQKNVLTI